MSDCNTKLSRPVSSVVPPEIIDELIDLIIELSERGEIRKTDDNRFSILDIIEIVTEKKNARSSWKRLLRAYPDLSHFATGYNFGKSSGYLDSPVIDDAGIIEIIWLLPGDFSQKFRRTSSKAISYLAKSRSVEESTAIAPVPVATLSPEITAIMSMVTSLSSEVKALANEVKETKENKRYIQEVAPGLTVTENFVIESKDALPAVVKYFTAPEWLEAHRSEFSCVPKHRFCLDVSRHYRVMLQNRPLQQNGKFLYNSTHEFVLRNIAESIKTDRKNIIEHNKLVEMKAIIKLNASS